MTHTLLHYTYIAFGACIRPSLRDGSSTSETRAAENRLVAQAFEALDQAVFH